MIFAVATALVVYDVLVSLLDMRLKGDRDQSDEKQFIWFPCHQQAKDLTQQLHKLASSLKIVKEIRRKVTR